MLKTLLARARQGYRSAAYPVTDPGLPPLFRGRPVVDPGKCAAGCEACAKACPAGALAVSEHRLELDIGRCIFCGDCAAVCPEGAITFSRDWRLAGSTREDLIVTGDREILAHALGDKLRRLLGRSLLLREVSAGGCNGCEAEVGALRNVVFDSSRFGIEIVASPRHADGILVTGPVTANMKEALRITYEAVAEPKLVIAAGACAISGGLFRGFAEVDNGVTELPVDLYVPGCPPHPLTILDGLLRLLGRPAA
jgi:Ni,Fe-hydrogenase III small subunit/Pyruvate/2-oxoacid:ferredoxin oxidoreductase delta subunit